jgi:hypothetical protein
MKRLLLESVEGIREKKFKLVVFFIVLQSRLFFSSLSSPGHFLAKGGASPYQGLLLQFCRQIVPGQLESLNIR